MLNKGFPVLFCTNIKLNEFWAYTCFSGGVLNNVWQVCRTSGEGENLISIKSNQPGEKITYANLISFRLLNIFLKKKG